MSEETLFHEALAKSAGERAAFLDAACAGQPQLRAAVAALLAAHEASGNFLQQPAAADHAPQPDEAPPQLAPTADYHPQVEAGLVIAGRYELQQKIGEGGMGEVWVAKQTEPVKRKVALKLIKTGMDSRAVLARFEQERQALALMDHPNIARVLDGGLTPSGQPFFVMELVNGLTLTKFCDEARLKPKDRLELFVPICQAVQHAHQKGIVHRDLKPANILVTLIDGRPVPKVIDFGLAKAVAGKLTDESLSTQFGPVVGTLEYMSPEQAGFADADIDTRADIYSLGVILYELLTGLRPIDAKRLKKAALTEMMRILKEEEPSKPSIRLSSDESLPSLAALRQTEPRKLMALLRGELDWVVMKCLEKPRDRRYETANALARDVQRYLADEPVEARPPSAGYRLGKFLRRNKRSMLAVGIVFAALLVGIAGTTFGLIWAEQRREEADKARADEAHQRLLAQTNEGKALRAAAAEKKAKERESAQRTKAEHARDRTRQALDAMTSSVTGDSLTTQKEISDEQKKFLSEVLTYYQEFAGDKADDEKSRARTALAASRVGHIEYRLGRKTEAAAAIRLARDGYAKLAADFPAVPLYRQNLASSHNNLGIQLAGVGKGPEAEQQYRQALAIYAKLATDFPAVPQYRQIVANSHNNLGALLNELGKRAEAEQQHRQALALYEKMAAGYPAEPAYRQEVAMTHDNLGIVLKDLGKRPEAEEQYRQALAIQEKLATDFPGVPEHRLELARSRHNLGNLLRDLGKRAEAEQQFRQTLAICAKLAADFPGVPLYRQGLAGSHGNLANLLADRGQRPEAEQQHRQALALFEKLAADFPAVPVYRRDLASSHDNLGRLLAGLGKRPEAEQQHRQALALFEKMAADFPAVPQYRQELAKSHVYLGNLLSDLGQRPEAEQQHRQALAIRQKLAADFPAVPAYRHELALSHHTLGTLLTGLGKRPEAEQQLRQALALQKKLAAEFPAVPPYRQGLANSHHTLGTLLTGLGKRPEAEEQYRQALALREKLFADFPAEVQCRHELAASRASLGHFLAGLGRRPEAEQQYRQALVLWEKLAADFPAGPQYQIGLGGTSCNLGMLLRDGGQPAQSLEWFDKAIRTLTAAYDHDRQLMLAKQFLRNSHWNRAMAHDRLQKYAEAVKDWDKAVALSPKAEQPGPRAARAAAWVKAGQVNEAVAEVAELSKTLSGNGAQWYDLACVCALASAKSADKKQAYADRAMDLLQQAVRAGFKDAAHMKADTDLDPLRAREDFQILLAKLAKKAGARPENQP